MTQALHTRMGEILMLVAADFQARLDADLRSRGIEGIGKRHADVFLYLGRHGALRSVDLANMLGIRPQSMMTIVDELEALKLVERRPDPRDSRAKLIHFSRQGKRLIRELTRSTQTVWQQYEQRLGAAQLESTFHSLEALLPSDEETT